MAATSHRRVQLLSGERLALTMTRPRGLLPWVVFAHGLGSNRNGEKALYIEDGLRAAGLGYARFDFRGHGDSEGSFSSMTLTRQIEDLSSIVSELKSVKETKVILVGSSLGALTAAWYSLSSLEPIAAQILLAPAFRLGERHFESLGEEELRRWETSGVRRFEGDFMDFELEWPIVEDTERYPLEELARRTRTATWILHGDADESVPIEHSRDFVEVGSRATVVLEEIEGGDHRLSEHRERILEVILSVAARVKFG